MQRLRDLIDSGCDLRLWCFRCARGAKLAILGEQLESVARRAVCKQCRQRDQMLLLPARSDFFAVTGADATKRLIEAAFHGMRREGKKRRR